MSSVQNKIIFEKNMQLELKNKISSKQKNV